MHKKPIFISSRTFRSYQDFALDSARAEGWNDAMRFIFMEELKEQEDNMVTKLRDSFYLITTEIEAEGE